jgi:hypothetical protein
MQRIHFLSCRGARASARQTEFDRTAMAARLPQGRQAVRTNGLAPIPKRAQPIPSEIGSEQIRIVDDEPRLLHDIALRRVTVGLEQEIACLGLREKLGGLLPARPTIPTTTRPTQRAFEKAQRLPATAWKTQPFDPSAYRPHVETMIAEDEIRRCTASLSAIPIHLARSLLA